MRVFTSGPDGLAMKPLDVRQSSGRRPLVRKQLVAQFADWAQGFTEECQVYMVPHGLGCMEDSQHTYLELQLFAKLAYDSLSWFFVIVNPTARQSPRISWMVCVFD
jgi:hypothetical protein